MCEIILTTDDRSSYRLVVYLAEVLSELVIIEWQFNNIGQELIEFLQISCSASAIHNACFTCDIIGAQVVPNKFKSCLSWGQNQCHFD